MSDDTKILSPDDMKTRVEMRIRNIREPENYAKMVSSRRAQEEQKNTPTVDIQDHEAAKKFDDYCLRTGDQGAGIKFAQINQDDLIYEKIGGDWYVWGGHFWQLAIMGEAQKNVAFLAQWYESKAAEAGVQRKVAIKKDDQVLSDRLKARMKMCNQMAFSLRTVRGRQNCLIFAATNHLVSLETSREMFDQNPMLLPCTNACVDLKTGWASPGRRKDLTTLACSVPWVDIEAQAPLWEQTLLASLGEAAKVDFFQRFMGYCLTGKTTLAVILILYGPGRNGKTLIIEVIMKIMGALAGAIPVEMLLDQGRFVSAAAPDASKISLKGKRFVAATESDEGRRISPSKVKQYSGGDTIVARGPHDKRMTQFEPTHKLVLMTNHLPGAPMSDYAFWSRINVLPFEFSFVDREPEAPNERRADASLKEKLLEEASGILAWLVRGSLKWQKDGLNPPESVKIATENYRRSEDLIADFLEECCLISPNEEENASALYDAFKEWWGNNVSKKPLSQKKFGMLLKGKFKSVKSSKVKYIGLRLLKG